MCCHVKEVSDSLLKKYECCRCCPDSAELKQAKAEGRRVEQYEFDLGTCPMAGRMAPFFAVGEHFESLSACRAKAETELLTSTCLGLADSQRTLVTDDFASAISQLQYVLELKTAYWKSLPWSLCGLAHPRADLAKAHARKLIPDLRD
eukprot:5000376-Alexandrium_andersonii.AAC.1